MDFSFMSDNDISELSASGYMLKPGPCQYQVMEASDHTSAAGNKSIKLKLNVKDLSGKKAHVFDYLSPKAQLIPFLASQGMQDAIDRRLVSASSLVGKTGMLKIKHENYNDQMQNKVGGYLNENPSAAQSPSPAKPVIDDDIPF